MKKEFKKEATTGISRTKGTDHAILTTADMAHLPAAVQRYLEFTGAAGKEKVSNLRLDFHMKLRSSMQSKWMKIHAFQYSFFDKPTRLFYMKASMMGIPARGLHCYKEGNASMLIKVLSLFPIIHEKGEEMKRSETVTMFNDMCLLAPATLIDPRIHWETIDSLKVKASFTVKDITISAMLYFDLEGRLVNFISNDRSMFTGKNQFQYYPWETPVKEYIQLNGRKYPASGEAIWKMPEGDFCYATFRLNQIEENVKSFK